MTYIVVALLILQAAFVAAFFMLSERREQRFAAEREAWVAERRELNQRIQAPEVAVAQAVQGDGSPGYIPVDDDAAYWKHLHEVAA